MKKETSKGFTLIELLVVIAIIGIIVGITFVSLSESREKGQDAGIKSQAQEILKSLELFYSDNGAYPADDVPLSEDTGGELNSTLFGVGGYMPREPENIENFTYCTTLNERAYVLFIDLYGDGNDCNIQRGPDAHNACTDLRTGSYATPCQIAF